MANREFSDHGRPDLFDEDGEFIGSASDYDFWTCRNCGESNQGISLQDAQENHDLWGDCEEFEVMAQIEDDVIDPEGKAATVTQIGEGGEVALVRYEDGTEGEWDLVDLLVKPEEDADEAF
ncbi:hypothetical protein HOU95_gp054 [Streptomyces phage Hiyaa]|uniref:Uncharacterized protein n=1 Tax=Streptomyces phage Hiyaa TaxID=2499072 RepID=A0A3S9U929_9CAUD|nr:hypothetical protein HOU95_gp054 [Streptomyces phage Hiyaa]AZS06753.1 hypothetical protein SEA_HIYAA_114 [Streptomyces phage Hiyaa]